MGKRLLGVMLVLTGVLNLQNLNGQNLDQHRWENRILIIQTPAESLPQYLEQLSEFENSAAELKERKLILYEVIKGKYRATDFQDMQADRSWKQSNEGHKNSLNQNDTFKVILIGLDGGIKLEQGTVLKKAELLGIIDSMPMRKAELKTKSKTSKKNG